MKTKEFDAVAMKDQCQEQVRREYEGLTDEEKRQQVEDWLAGGDDAMAQLWRKIHEPHVHGHGDEPGRSIS